MRYGDRYGAGHYGGLEASVDVTADIASLGISAFGPTMTVGLSVDAELATISLSALAPLVAVQIITGAVGARAVLSITSARVSPSLAGARLVHP